MKIIHGFPKVSSKDVHQQSQQDICRSGQANPPGCFADDTHVQMDLPDSYKPPRTDATNLKTLPTQSPARSQKTQCPRKQNKLEHLLLLVPCSAPTQTR